MCRKHYSQTIPAGTYVVLTTGRYSDYTIHAAGITQVPIVLDDDDPNDLSAQYRKETGLKPWDDADKFIHWLMNIKGYVKELEYEEVNIENI